MPDLLATVSALPKGLCGVVFRNDGEPRRAELAQAVFRICRQRCLAMVVAGHPIGAVQAGRHLREGFGNTGHRLSTTSAHGRPALLRARRAGVAAAFLSPVFATASHPHQATLGVLRWAVLARPSGAVPVFALGGIDGRSVRRLPRWVEGVGAIGAFAG